MGRSIEPASDAELLATTQPPVTIRNEKLDRTFEVFSKGSEIYQKEYAVANGERVFENAYKLEYIIGSGENGRTPVVRRGNFLVEAPLTYYSKPRKWALSPGFESVDSGFNRPILEPCIRCHSGNPQPAASGNGRYQDPAFKEMAIGCENCHGPGSVHADRRGRGLKVSGADSTIVNPKKLSMRLADEICMTCHQGGDTRILQPGKTYADLRPGTPMAQTLAIFKVQPQRATSSR